MNCGAGRGTGSIQLNTPTAAKRPYTAAGGESMNVWFDRTPQFLSLGLDDVEDSAGSNQSIEQVVFINLIFFPAEYFITMLS